MPDALELVARVRARMIDLGFEVFEGADSLNVVGLRSPSREAGTFDDWLVCFYRDLADVWVAHCWQVTTDPGLTYLHDPLNAAGCAILLPGQYRGAYQIGKHRGRYTALVQRGPMSIVRDDDRDEHLDLDTATQASGLFGINIHASDSNPYDADDQTRDEVGPWSAGCQVFAASADFRDFMAIAERSAERYGSTFTYTLLDWPVDATLADTIDPLPVVPAPPEPEEPMPDPTTPTPGPTGNNTRLKGGGMLATLLGAYEALGQAGVEVSEHTATLAVLIGVALLLADAIRPMFKGKGLNEARLREALELLTKDKDGES